MSIASDGIDYTVMEGPEFLQTIGTDAVKWAAAFNQIAQNLGYAKMDEGWLIGWFANAVMMGYDTAKGISPVVLPDGSAFFVGTVN